MLSVSTGLKGFKWRRQRELGTEISDLKKTVRKVLGEGESHTSEELATLKKVDELTAERKELSGQNNKDR